MAILDMISDTYDSYIHELTYRQFDNWWFSPAAEMEHRERTELVYAYQPSPDEIEQMRQRRVFLRQERDRIREATDWIFYKPPISRLEKCQIFCFHIYNRVHWWINGVVGDLRAGYDGYTIK